MVGIKFCISSNINFSNKTFPIIVNSLLEANIQASDIYFFIGGMKTYEKLDSIVNAYYCDNNSFDLTSLIAILDLGLKSDYWFLLHDTCYVGKSFKDNIMRYTYNTDTLRLYSGASMNIGAYSQSYLDKEKDLILSYKNQDYSFESLQRLKSRLVTEEDFLFKKSICKVYTDRVISEGPIDFYSNGVGRIIEHYNDVDLHKLKANWFGKSIYETKL